MTENEKDDQFVNTLMLTNDDEQPSTTITNVTFISHIRFVPLTVSIIFLLLGLVNMIAFYVIPMNRINENKKHAPNAIFSEPNTVIIVLHFIFNSLVIFFGICLLLFSLRGFFIRHSTIIIVFLVASCSFVFIFWVTYVTIVFTSTEKSNNIISIDDLEKSLNKESPIDFSFIYSKEMMKTHDCSHNPNTGQMACTTRYLTCYSKNGVVFPLESKNLNDRFDQSTVPDIFYFKLEQDVMKSDDYKLKFDQLMDKINDCSYENKSIDYFPEHNETMLVSNEKIPSYLTHKSRIISAVFGVGVYYELNTRSIPLVNYKQKVLVDTRQGFNYESLWTEDSCNYYGECDPYNDKPVPIV